MSWFQRTMTAGVSGDKTHSRDIWKKDRGKKVKDKKEASEKKLVLEDELKKKVKS